MGATRKRTRSSSDSMPDPTSLGWPSVVSPERQPGATSPQVALHTDGLLAPLDEPPGGLPARLQPRSGVPAHQRGGGRPARLWARARPSLPLAQALVDLAVLRARRPAGPDPGRGPPGRAVRGLGARRARLGGLRAAALLPRL